MSRSLLFVLLLATGVALADDPPKAKTPPAAAGEQEKAKEDPNAKKDPSLGMSILGNQETPKALVIVPWKSSEIGNALGISTMLDDSKLPIDKEVFMRALSYYEIRSETTPHDGTSPAPAARRSKS
jgi:hypothetical protein